jgi:hypothetical protein
VAKNEIAGDEDGEVDLFAEEVDGHEERSLRDFLFFRDPSSHTQVLSVDAIRFSVR